MWHTVLSLSQHLQQEPLRSIPPCNTASVFFLNARFEPLIYRLRSGFATGPFCSKKTPAPRGVTRGPRGQVQTHLVACGTDRGELSSFQGRCHSHAHTFHNGHNRFSFFSQWKDLDSCRHFQLVIKAAMTLIVDWLAVSENRLATRFNFVAVFERSIVSHGHQQREGVGSVYTQKNAGLLYLPKHRVEPAGPFLVYL